MLAFFLQTPFIKVIFKKINKILHKYTNEILNSNTLLEDLII